MGVGNSQSAPPVDTTVNETMSDTEVTFKLFGSNLLQRQATFCFFSSSGPAARRRIRLGRLAHPIVRSLPRSILNVQPKYELPSSTPFGQFQKFENFEFLKSQSFY